MNETGKTRLSRNAEVRKRLNAFGFINMPFRVYDFVIGYFTTPDLSCYWDEVCDIGGALDAFNTEVVFVVSQVSEGSNDVAFFITMVVPYADIIANGLVGKKVKALGLKGGVPGRDISAELLPGGNMTSNSTGSSGSQGVDINDFTQGLAYQTTFNGDYVSSVNFNNDLNKTGNSTSENLDKLNGLNANKAMSLAEEEGTINGGNEPPRGGITFGEADGHYKWGNGQPMYVDLKQLDFGTVNMSRFDKPEFFIEDTLVYMFDLKRATMLTEIRL